MRRKWALVFFSLIAFAGGSPAQEIKPAAVSPGNENGVARVSEQCPTFSWSAIGWAVGYRVAVFEARTAEVKTYESRALAAMPILRKDIQGKALSWTPSANEQLKDGKLYVWYVRARDASGNGLWSAGKAFLVEVEKTPIVGVNGRAIDKFRQRGIDRGVIAEAASETRLGSGAWTISKAFSLKGEGRTATGGRGGTGAPTSIGLRALGNETGSNTWYGEYAGASLVGDANHNSFFGMYAGNRTSKGNSNTFVGAFAGVLNTTGSANTFLGMETGKANTIGRGNTFVGDSAGSFNTEGDGNIFIGFLAGVYNATGSYNTLVGTNADRANETGSNNTMIGYAAGFNNEAGNNTYVGYEAGYVNRSGGANTFVGFRAGKANVSSWNTFFGFNAGVTNTSGSSNVFLGGDAGYNSTEGSFNTFLGRGAGYKATTGSQNTYLGSYAGDRNVSGARNVFLGYGAGSSETGSDKLYISNSTATFPLIYGNFKSGAVAVKGRLGVGVRAPQYPLQMASGARCTTGGVWTNASSRSLKENIHNLATEEAREALAGLVPVRFNYKADKAEECLGFIAEDVPALLATKDRKGLSPMDVVAVLTKVVQEQQKIVRDQQKTIDGQQMTNDELRKMIDELRMEIDALKQKTK